ncbi:MAG: hypothetical protein OHK0039_03210 [Bacteroidia bacterium]
MSKLSQLETLRDLGLPTPAFRAIGYAAFQAGQYSLRGIRFPVAVRSTYAREDAATASMAGRFPTLLRVEEYELPAAIGEVFAAYPDPGGQQVIVQEMAKADYSGVLFAYRTGVWKVEFARGPGDALMSGRIAPEVLLLPRFTRQDLRWGIWLRRWRPFGKRQRAYHSLVPPLLRLSVYAGRLLDHYLPTAPHGLDIEFAIVRGRLYLLQCRPITTGSDAEELLTAANHKEILPPYPSRFMTALIGSCSSYLFSYYKRMDPTLADRNFIEVSAGMPWINLSALLDIMVAWGLPTSLVCESVGAEDPYHVRARPYASLRKWPVFVRLLKEQVSVVSRAKRWVRRTQRTLSGEIEGRRLMWRNNPDLAYNNWLTNMQLVYVELVSLVQALTAAMSVPLKLLARIGRLPRLSSKSESTRYLDAFCELREGSLSRGEFVSRYGHRGFYESDLGQKRFAEYDDDDWASLAEVAGPAQAAQPADRTVRRSVFSWVARPFIGMMMTREWLRHHAMRYFYLLREELHEHLQARFGPDFDFAAYDMGDLARLLEGNLDLDDLRQIDYPQQAGWQPDTFLRNRLDRRLPLSLLVNAQAARETQPQGLGIYPGRVRGQIWRVAQARLGEVRKPAYPVTILLTESLDPGWIPYFVQVDGVLSYVGGLLSHASIILRESGIPSITRVSRQLGLSEGDWVEIDGRTGEVTRVEPG